MDLINGSNYVDKAEAAIVGLIEDAKQAQIRQRREPNRYRILTTTQLRKQLSMTSELFAQAERELSSTLSQEVQDSIEYLRVQFVYQAGREDLVKRFVEKTGVLDILKDIKGSRESFLTYCRYMEALVAFHRYYGGKDS